MSTKEETNRVKGLPCPDCGYVLRSRYYILSGTLMTGGPCPECSVTLYRQYVQSRFALTKRAAFVVWPAFIGSTFWLDHIMGWLVRNVSPWLLVAIPVLVFTAIFGTLVGIHYFPKMQLKRMILATDVGGWSLAKRRLSRYSVHTMMAIPYLWLVVIPSFWPEVSDLIEHVPIILPFLPALAMMIVGHPYAHTQTPKRDGAQELPKDDGWIAVESE